MKVLVINVPKVTKVLKLDKVVLLLVIIVVIDAHWILKVCQAVFRVMTKHLKNKVVKAVLITLILMVIVVQSTLRLAKAILITTTPTLTVIVGLKALGLARLLIITTTPTSTFIAVHKSPMLVQLLLITSTLAAITVTLITTIKVTTTTAYNVPIIIAPIIVAIVVIAKAAIVIVVVKAVIVASTTFDAPAVDYTINSHSSLFLIKHASEVIATKANITTEPVVTTERITIDNQFQRVDPDFPMKSINNPIIQEKIIYLTMCRNTLVGVLNSSTNWFVNFESLISTCYFPLYCKRATLIKPLKF